MRIARGPIPKFNADVRSAGVTRARRTAVRGGDVDAARRAFAHDGSRPHDLEDVAMWATVAASARGVQRSRTLSPARARLCAVWGCAPRRPNFVFRI